MSHVKRNAGRTRPKGMSRRDVLRLLPTMGINAGLDQPFPCVMPGHEGHDAVVDGRSFAYRCLGHGSRCASATALV